MSGAGAQAGRLLCIDSGPLLLWGPANSPTDLPSFSVICTEACGHLGLALPCVHRLFHPPLASRLLQALRLPC